MLCRSISLLTCLNISKSLQREYTLLRCVTGRNYSNGGGGGPDTSGLIEKGKAEENIYFRKKELSELKLIKRKLERLERLQQMMEDKLDEAETELKAIKKKAKEAKKKEKRLK